MKKSLLITILTGILLFSMTTGVVIHLFIQPNQSDIKTIRATLTPPPYLIGIVQSDYNYLLKFNPTLGYIQDIHVKNGERVDIDTPLVTYHNPAKIPEINALNTLLKLPLDADQTFETNKEIMKLKANLYHTIQSPTQGIVRLHESVPEQNKEKILEITSEEQHILVKVPENLYTKFKQGNTVNLRSRFNGKEAKGTVVSRHWTPISSSKSKHQSYYFTKIKTPKNYPIGTHFDIQYSNALIVLPSDILIDENSVLIYKKDKLIKRIISYDKINEQLIIKNGIFVGEKVVRFPHDQKIKIENIER